MKYIVAKIHNQSLGKVVEASSMEDGNNIIRDWFNNQFQRDLNDEERDDLENNGEVCNMEDPDNHYTFSIGIVE
jgi:hypothetical protein